MIRDFERFHGAVLRSIVVESPEAISITPCDSFGRVNSYLVNERVAFHIKHSSKRLPPWGFTFNDEHLDEIFELEQKTNLVWLVLVCGSDGVVALSLDEFRDLTTATPQTTCFVRIDRDRRTMYRVFGNAGKLNGAKPNGVTPLIDDACGFGA